MYVVSQEPRQLRNNRKKPKKFSDGDPSVTPSKDDSMAASNGGNASDHKKTPASRELSRLSDDVIVGSYRKDGG